MDAGMIAGFRQIGGPSVFQEIGHTLGGRHLASAAMLLGSLLQLLLIGDAGQDAMFGMKGPDVLRFHGDHQAAVGKGGVSTRQAHAIDHDLIVFRGRRNDKPSRTHAEGMDAAFFYLGGQPITGRRKQIGTSGLRIEVVLKSVDEGLRVLDPDADRKGFGFQMNVMCLKHPVDVPGRMTRCQDDAIGLQG